MKSPFPPYLKRLSGFLVLIAAVFGFVPDSEAQVLLQDFNGLQNLNQFQSSNPDIGQVDRINLTRSGDEREIFTLGTEGDNKFLLINKMSNLARHFDRTTGINNEPFLRISFDFTVQNTTAAGKIAAFFVGNNLGPNSFFPDRQERWVQIGIIVNPDKSFQLAHENLYTNGDVFEVSRSPRFTNGRISLIMSNSDDDNNLVYAGPDGRPSEIKKGEVHIWIGKDYKLEGPALRGSNSSINAVKFLLWNTGLSATARMDNISITKDIEIDPLPVELTHFTAKAADESIILNWETASEFNSSHFNIERSFDGIHFENVGIVEAAGNSSRRVEYHFVDKNAAGTFGGLLYYRLHQIDFDGSSAYSPLINVPLPAGKTTGLKAFPNPFEEEIRVRFLAERNSRVNFLIRNIQGEKLFEETKYLEASGQSQEHILKPPPELPAGIYLLQMKAGEQTIQQKIVKY